MRIVNARLYTASGWQENGYMDVDDNGRIEALGSHPDPVYAGRIVDADGAMVVPGLVDVHVHGGGGFDAMSGDASDLNGMSLFHARGGTTSFLATTMTAPEADIVRALTGIRPWTIDGTGRRLEGADLMGVHLEGPFLNPAKCGAQNPANLRFPSLAEWNRYTEIAGEGTIRLLTIAPELEGAREVIQAAAAAGVTVSIGHSDADYDTVKAAVQWGCRHATHTFNGMRGLHHRDPGVVGGALLLDEITVELIADGVHVHPDLVAGMLRLKPRGKVVLITDCIKAGGCPDGEYELGGLPIRMEADRAYVRLPNGERGSLAGSSLTMLEALLNVARFAGCPPEDCLDSLTINPARQAGIAHRKGSLEAGKDADFLIVNDDWTLIQTFVRGKCVYDRHNIG